MRRLFVLMLIVCGVSLKAQEAAYQAGDYGEAAQAYERQIAAGQASGELYYNLGVTYYQMGETGRALLNLRRAQQYLPRHAAVHDALNQIQPETAQETDVLNTIGTLTHNWLTLSELSYGAFALWLLFFTLLGIRVYVRRAVLKWILLGAGMLLLLSLSLLGSRLYVENFRPQAVIIQNDAEVMSGAGSGYLTLFTLAQADEGRIMERRGSWLRLRLPDGREGWVMQSSLERVKP